MASPTSKGGPEYELVVLHRAKDKASRPSQIREGMKNNLCDVEPDNPNSGILLLAKSKLFANACKPPDSSSVFSRTSLSVRTAPHAQCNCRPGHSRKHNPPVLGESLTFFPVMAKRMSSGLMPAAGTARPHKQAIRVVHWRRFLAES